MSNSFHMGSAPRGRKLESNEPEQGHVGTWGTNRAATEHLLERAREYFQEASLEDFDHPRERLFVDRATGVEYLVVGSDPLAAASPRATQVACFLVDEYGEVVYLRKRGDFGEPADVVRVGTMSSVGRVELDDDGVVVIY